jgi:hypothetical protein
VINVEFDWIGYAYRTGADGSGTANFIINAIGYTPGTALVEWRGADLLIKLRVEWKPEVGAFVLVLYS